jgi:arsenite transporter
MSETRKIAFFEKYLTLWVALCIVGGILIGQWFGEAITVMSGWEIASVNIPVAILIWLMIYPMMLQIDFSSIKKIGKKPKGLILTLVINWLIKAIYHGLFCLDFLFKAV